MKLIITFLYSTLMMLLLASCGIKSVSKTISKGFKDSSTATYKDTFTTRKTDIKKTTAKDSTGKKETVDSSEVIIVFADDDTSTTTKPVVIKKDSTQTIVDAGGRKIKSIKTKNSTVVKDSSGKKETSNTNITGNDSSGKKETSNTQVKQTTQQTTVIKKGKTVVGWILSLWWLWLILLLVVAYKWLKKYYTLPF